MQIAIHSVSNTVHKMQDKKNSKLLWRIILNPLREEKTVAFYKVFKERMINLNVYFYIA